MRDETAVLPCESWSRSRCWLPWVVVLRRCRATRGFPGKSKSIGIPDSDWAGTFEARGQQDLLCGLLIGFERCFRGDGWLGHIRCKIFPRTFAMPDIKVRAVQNLQLGASLATNRTQRKAVGAANNSKRRVFDVSQGGPADYATIGA
jgi:hypothetical protein